MDQSMEDAETSSSPDHRRNQKRERREDSDEREIRGRVEREKELCEDLRQSKRPERLSNSTPV